MAKLTGMEILRQVELGHIVIDPFDPSQINPNSYNVRLGDTLKVYCGDYTRPGIEVPPEEVKLDSHGVNPTKSFKIGKEGFLLQPGILYLGATVEYTKSDYFIPIIDGRSSIGRLGIEIHLTAGFGDIGFQGTWTLEIAVVHPVLIYPGDELAQLSFEPAVGDISYKYKGRYLGQKDPTESRLNQEKKGAFVYE